MHYTHTQLLHGNKRLCCRHTCEDLVKMVGEEHLGRCEYLAYTVEDVQTVSTKGCDVLREGHRSHSGALVLVTDRYR